MGFTGAEAAELAIRMMRTAKVGSTLASSRTSSNRRSESAGRLGIRASTVGRVGSVSMRATMRSAAT